MLTVYVDALKDYPPVMVQPAAERYGTVWCHMTADTLEELHAFAQKVGMYRSWFQDPPTHPHYDLTPSRRRMAVMYGAVYKEE